MLGPQVYIVIAAYAAVFAATLTGCSLPLLGIVQQLGYEGLPFLKWYWKRGNMVHRRYRLLALCLVLMASLLGLCFSFLGPDYADIIAGAGYLGLCALFCFAFRRAVKVPVRFTHRMVRLTVCYAVFLLGALFGTGVGLYALAEAIGPLARVFRMAPIGLFPCLLWLLLLAAGTVMKGYEIPHGRSFVKKAKTVLAQSSCIKVGITGSYGKTGVKHAAAQMLSAKYRVLATPASYNTPLGVARCVNGGCDCDIFLAEMGARHTGDIAELCDLVQPTIGVVTGVGTQHLETFGSLKAIRREKGELARRVQTAVLGCTAADLRGDALIEGRDFGAEHVVISPTGTTFDLCLSGERRTVSTSLLGRHAAEDIALAACLCRESGMTMSEICAQIPLLKPVEHRLQRIEANGVVILDDSYNSNLEGACNALEVLKVCTGKRIAVTPGLVELGALEESSNHRLGENLVGLDAVILVGETLVLPVRKGYLDAGGQEERLRIVPTLEEAARLLQTLLSAGDTVLFLNDLPDKYL